MQTKSFSFLYNGYDVKAEAELYPDGSIADIEILEIWAKDKDLLSIYRSDGRWDPYVRSWMKNQVATLKQYGAQTLQHLLMDAAGMYYEYDFL